MDCSHKHSFCLLQNVNWWTGLVWITLWCFYQTLILTAPIHFRASFAEQVMQCYSSPNLMKKQTWIAWGWGHFQLIFIFALGEIFLKKETSNVTLEHKTSLKSLGYICRTNHTLYGSKFRFFLLCQKIIRILWSCSVKIFCKFLQ